jgi:hypothetical protein
VFLLTKQKKKLTVDMKRFEVGRLLNDRGFTFYANPPENLEQKILFLTV